MFQQRLTVRFFNVVEGYCTGGFGISRFYVVLLILVAKLTPICAPKKYESNRLGHSARAQNGTVTSCENIEGLALYYFRLFSRCC